MKSSNATRDLKERILSNFPIIETQTRRNGWKWKIGSSRVQIQLLEGTVQGISR